MNKASLTAIAVLLLTAAGLGGLYWYQQQGRKAPASPPVAAAPPAPPAAPAPSAPAIRHPVDPALAASAPAVRAGTDANSVWRAALGELTNPSTVLRFWQTDDFARRVVVTIDNLARPHAAPALWPLHPTPGRFSVTGEGDTRTAAPTNPARYAPIVGMLTQIDAKRAAALYAQMYPQLQKAYEEAGYPGRYFNDRVVEVIDQLLRTPEPAEPLALTLTDVKGEVPSSQPWLRYEFADPELQQLAAGQKMLLRVGKAHRQALKARLAKVRTLIARRGSSPPS